MLFSELYKIMVKKVTFVCLRGGAIAPVALLDPLLVIGRTFVIRINKKHV